MTLTKKSWYVPKTNCRHCNQLLDQFPDRANHVKWCDKNPKRKQATELLIIARSKISNQSLGRSSEKIKELHRIGHYDYTKLIGKGVPHSEETKAKISKAALASNHQRICKRTHEYVDKNGRVFKFDSSWEDVLANRLDELDIKWDRPEPISYELNGKIRKYFPDFFLPEHNLFLDPKNSYCREVQKDKISIISKIINLVILKTLEECKHFSVDETEINRLN